MINPFHFVKFLIKLHPDLLQTVANHHELQAQGAAEGIGADADESDVLDSQGNHVCKHLDIVRSFKVLNGKQKGRMRNTYKCSITSVSD